MFKWAWLWWHRWDAARRIRKHGWTGIYVGDYHSAPTWVYSIGFDEALNQPEIIVFDIPKDAANALFQEVFRHLEEGTLILEDGKVWPEGEERPCVWRKVHHSQIDCDRGWFALSVRRYALRTGRTVGLEAFQLVLSDNEGRLPWEDGYDEQLRHLQPALYLPVGEALSSLAAKEAV